MKKVLLFFLGLTGSLFLAAPTQAQQAYAQGDKILNVGLNLGMYNYGYIGNRSGFLPINASFEVAKTDKLSFGGYAGFASWKYKYTGGNFGWNYIALGAKGSFHYLPWLNENLDLGMDEEKFDLYVSVLVGVELRRYTGEYAYLDYGNSAQFRLGPVLGIKYMFNPKFGAFFEAGRGALGYGNIGVSARF